jgi:hypothetical protein
MASYGTTAGIGEGIQQAASAIGQALRERGERRTAELDKTRDKLDQEIKDNAYNLVQKLGGRSFTQVMADPARTQDHPEIAGLYNQLSQSVQKLNATYPAHETPQFIQRLQKLAGKQPGAPQVDPRTTTAAQAMASASRLAPNRTPNLLDEWGWTKQMAREMLGENATEQEVAEKAGDLMTRSGRSGAQQLQTYQGPNGEFMRVPFGSPEEEELRSKGWKLIPYASFAQKTYTPDAVRKAALAYSRFGLKPPPQMAGDVTQLMIDEKMPDPPNLLAQTQTLGWAQDDQGRVFAVKIDRRTNQPIPGTEDYSAPVPAQYQPQYGIIQILGPDGVLHAAPYTKERPSVIQPYTPALPGTTGPQTVTAPTAQSAAPAGSAPPAVPETTPPAVPSAAGQRRGGITFGPQIDIGAKATPAFNDADKKYAAALPLVKFADDALRYKDSAHDLMLIDMLTTEASRRFNATTVDRLINPTFKDQLLNLKARWTTGALLDPSVRARVVQTVKDLVKDLKETRDQLQPAGNPDQDLHNRLIDATK